MQPHGTFRTDLGLLLSATLGLGACALSHVDDVEVGVVCGDVVCDPMTEICAGCPAHAVGTASVACVPRDGELCGADCGGQVWVECDGNEDCPGSEACFYQGADCSDSMRCAPRRDDSTYGLTCESSAECSSGEACEELAWGRFGAFRETIGWTPRVCR